MSKLSSFFGALFSSKDEAAEKRESFGDGTKGHNGDQQSGVPYAAPTYGVPVEMTKEAEFKIVVIGGTAVGKSSIIRRYTQDLFTQHHVPTIGIDRFSSALKQTRYPNLPTLVRLNFWDIAHNEVGGKHHMRLFEKANAVIMVFEANESLQRNKSLRAVDQWHHVIAEQLGGESVPMILFANKADNGSLAIKSEVLDDYTQKCGYIAWYETSAKTGQRVRKAIDHLVMELLKSADHRIEESRLDEQRKRRERKFLANNNKIGSDKERDSGNSSGGEKEQEKDRAPPSPGLQQQGHGSTTPPTASNKGLPLEQQVKRQVSREQVIQQEIVKKPVLRTSDGQGGSITKYQQQTQQSSTAGREKKPTEEAKEKESLDPGQPPVPKGAEQRQQAADALKTPRTSATITTPSLSPATSDGYGCSESKANEVHLLIEEFYKQLRFDLDQLLQFGSFNSRRVSDIQALQQQAENEYRQLTHRLLTVNWATESSPASSSSEAQGTADADLRKLHISISENIRKWQRLMHNLETEVSLACLSFSSLIPPPRTPSPTPPSDFSSPTLPMTPSPNIPFMFSPSPISPASSFSSPSSPFAPGSANMRYTSFFLGSGGLATLGSVRADSPAGSDGAAPGGQRSTPPAILQLQQIPPRRRKRPGFGFKNAHRRHHEGGSDLSTQSCPTSANTISDPSGSPEQSPLTSPLTSPSTSPTQKRRGGGVGTSGGGGGRFSVPPPSPAGGIPRHQHQDDGGDSGRGAQYQQRVRSAPLFGYGRLDGSSDGLASPQSPPSAPPSPAHDMPSPGHQHSPSPSSPSPAKLQSTLYSM